MKTTIKLQGMHCEGCVKRIENVLVKIKGINNFKVNLEEQTILLEVKNEKKIEEIKAKIETIGFKIEQ